MRPRHLDPGRGVLGHRVVLGPRVVPDLNVVPDLRVVPRLRASAGPRVRAPRAPMSLALLLLLAACDSDPSAPPPPLAERPPAGECAGCVVTFDALLAEMTDLARLTRLPEVPYTTRQASSYDRRSVQPDDDPEGWFANRDHNHFLREELREGRVEHVMAELEGPGVIQRIWSATPRGTIRVYVDDMETPVIEANMEALFNGQVEPFVDPYAYVAAAGANLYFPIPFAERAKVTTDFVFMDPNPEPFFYHVGYRLYATDVDVQSWDPAIVEAAALDDTAARLLDPSAIVDGLDPGAERPLALSPGGEPARFTVEGGGRLEAFEVTPSSDDPAALRRTLVIVEADGEETVRVPVAELFGVGPGLHAYESYPVTIGDDGHLSFRWPMPFAETLTVRLEAVGGGGVSLDGRAFVVAAPFDARSLYLYARWRVMGTRDTRPFFDWNHVDVFGQGHLVGSALNVTNPDAAWWGEGDEKIYVDGEAFPSFFGTGTEDYYGYAWLSTLYFGRPYHHQANTPEGPGNAGYTSNGRWHVMDPIPFQNRLRFDMEVWTWERDSVVDMDAATFFYARPGAMHNAAPTRPEHHVIPEFVPPPDP